MSDPTTAEIRTRWIAFDPKPFSTGGTAGEEFDRWLAGIKAEGRAELIAVLIDSAESLGEYATPGELIETARAMDRGTLSPDARLPEEGTE